MSRAATLDLEAPTPLVLQLLEWVAARPRTYRDTMEAWRTLMPTAARLGGRAGQWTRHRAA